MFGQGFGQPAGAGFGGQPGFGGAGFGGQPGFGGMQFGMFQRNRVHLLDANSIAQMMNNPMIQASLQQMLQNPEMMQMMMQNNPLAQGILQTNPEVAAMLQNPQFLQ